MRVLAINDISCVGKCSLTVTLPILSACGVTCDVLPTALLSTHTGGFEGYFFRDLTDDIPAILAHWKSLGLKFDVIYSGYLGNIEQINLVFSILDEFLAENGQVVVDPVMGDSGNLYAGFSSAFVREMRRLCRRADFILPNVTEACYLADMPFPPTKETIPQMLARLRTLCPVPIITGVIENEEMSVYYTDTVGKVHAFTHENVKGFFHGAGDVFSSAFVGCLAKGKTVAQAITLASSFTSAACRRSANEVSDKRFGLNFETEIFGFLQKLNT